MKMVKILLLSSAAGLIAIAGARAADLPVKAKAVEYVRVCTLYGVGYYYIPGTNTCIKIGGYVRYEAYHNMGPGSYPDNINQIGAFTRHSNTWTQQARFRLSADTRTQTEYGTLRSYFRFGANARNAAYETAPGGAPTTSLDRAFIQFAGFTIGRSDTFFGFWNGGAYGFVPLFLDGSSGPAGHNVFAYTRQFGDGLSATLSLEDVVNRVKPVINLDNTSLYGASDMAGQKVPDIVGNLRIDQAWGSAQVMAGLHQVSGRYYAENLATSAGATLSACTQPNTTNCNHPSDEWGWGIGGGLTLKMPWDAKDTLSGVIAYSQGAIGFVAYGMGNEFLHKQGVATGTTVDGVYGSPGRASLNGEIELTEAWGGSVSFQHYWTPSLSTSVIFGYLEVNYNDNAKALIRSGGCVGATGTNGVFASNANLNCDPDWSIWRLSSRTLWNPAPNLDVGIEVGYTKLNTAWAGLGDVAAANGLARGIYVIQDQNVWTATFRVQRNFWP